MSHSDIIIITVTLFVTSTAGVYVAVRYTNLLTRPPVNTLTRRSGDIELQYIEPSTNNTLDLLQPEEVSKRVQQDYTSERITNSSEGITSSLGNNPPSYHTLDLLQPQQVYIHERIPIFERIPSSNTNFYSDDSINLQRIPGYFNDLYINSCLEDSINLKYILFIVMLTIFLTLITKLIYFK